MLSMQLFLQLKRANNYKSSNPGMNNFSIILCALQEHLKLEIQPNILELFHSMTRRMEQLLKIVRIESVQKPSRKLNLETILFATVILSTVTSCSASDMTISTKTIEKIPPIENLRKLCQSLATLDAIIEPDWQYRYWSFDAHWNKDESVASMRNGEGDNLFIWFGPPGAAIKGFAHESPMSPYGNAGTIHSGILDNVPSSFKSVLNEPAFDMKAITFFIWRETRDNNWHVGKIKYTAGRDPDGSEGLLKMLDSKPETYQKWAEEYYERTIPLEAVKSIYAHKPLTDEIIKQLNEKNSLSKLAKDLQEIGYPYNWNDN